MADVGWIPVDERLPDIGIDVLVTNGEYLTVGRHVTITSRFEPRSGDEAIWLGENEEWPHFTHWQPLPEPPSKPKHKSPPYHQWLAGEHLEASDKHMSELEGWLTDCLGENTTENARVCYLMRQTRIHMREAAKQIKDLEARDG